MENWIELPDSNGYYWISSLGNILSTKLKKERKIVLDHAGYGRLTLQYSSKGFKQTWMAHRLIAIYFIPNPLNLPEVNHKNGIKADNRVANLEWCTAKENTDHAFDTGLRKRFQSEETKKLMSINRQLSDNHGKGIRKTLEHRQKISKANRGKIRSEETIKRIVESKKSPILDRSTNVLFESTQAAATHFGVSPGFLKECMRGRYNPLQNLVRICPKGQDKRLLR